MADVAKPMKGFDAGVNEIAIAYRSDTKARSSAPTSPARATSTAVATLTQAGLEAFCTCFLTSCVDQVGFMESLLEPAELLRRMDLWCEEETRAKRLPKGSWPLLREVVLTGAYARRKAPELTGYQERQARTVLNKLIDRGLLVSPTTRTDVRLGLPISVVDRWFPRLYPGSVSAPA
jgi:hypothetical protein